MAFPYTLRIPYTLSIMANVGRDAALNTIKRGFVAEFDCELEVEYEDLENWEVASVRFEQTRWNDEFNVSEETDPDLWKLVQRGLDYDWKDVQDKVRECILSDAADYADDRGDYLRDQMIDRWQESR